MRSALSGLRNKTPRPGGLPGGAVPRTLDRAKRHAADVRCGGRAPCRARFPAYTRDTAGRPHTTRAGGRACRGTAGAPSASMSWQQAALSGMPAGRQRRRAREGEGGHCRHCGPGQPYHAGGLCSGHVLPPFCGCSGGGARAVPHHGWPAESGTGGRRVLRDEPGHRKMPRGADE